MNDLRILSTLKKNAIAKQWCKDEHFVSGGGAGSSNTLLEGVDNFILYRAVNHPVQLIDMCQGLQADNRWVPTSTVTEPLCNWWQ